MRLRTRFAHADELYYPPYDAAVAAGVSGAMCSYNKINGSHACGSRSALKADLKGAMGFNGFVISDWGATHSTSLPEGLDVEMPMASDSIIPVGTFHYFDPASLAKLDQSEVDAAAVRVVSAALRLGLDNHTHSPSCDAPPCRADLSKNVTSDAHAALAREAAASSIVLLHNRAKPSAADGPLLPLSKAACSSIAVIGSVAVAQPYLPYSGAWNKGDYYSGGGSGHIAASRSQVITPLDGISARAKAAGLQVVNASSDDIGVARGAAARVDVAIVVVGATSGEAEDRKDLKLENGGDALVQAVAQVARRVIVLCQVPGAVLTPWRGQVDALLMMFLGGQGTGAAWADVLFGDVTPSGKLPISLPASEDETIAPSSSNTVKYSEGMYTSYRNPAIFPAFAFGFGLSYTEFDYGQPSAQPSFCKVGSEPAPAACVSLVVSNAGNASGAEIAQIYLTFPEAAKHPPGSLLKAFQKTRVLKPGESQRLAFRFTRRDLSYYSVEAGAWVLAGAMQAHIRTSSSASDTRQTIGINPKAEAVRVPES